MSETVVVELPKIELADYPQLNQTLASGGGIAKEPFKPRGSAKIEDILDDVQHMANMTGREVFFQFNGEVAVVNKYMEVKFEKVEEENSIQQLISENAKKLAEAGHRALRPEEMEEFRKDLQKNVK